VGGDPWWRAGVAYQVYPRSFADSNGDGIGDLGGIRARLGHLAWLGVDAVWLSPFYPSPMVDFGYDITDHCGVDPVFGSLDDVDALIAEAHAAGLRVLVDWVPNHTSDQHPWFLESRASRDSPKRDWYVWRPPAPSGGPPNNWVAAFAPEPAWTLDETTGEYYLHCFLPEQPDLDWSNPEVVAAMYDVARFWLDRGVDGFRIDVVHLIGKDPALADDPPELLPIPHVGLNDRPETHPLLRGIRTLLDSRPGERVAVGEVYLLDLDRIATYYGRGDELHLAFNFPALHAQWDAAAWLRQIEWVADRLDPIDAWPTWVLSNHDHPRHRTRLGGSEARARAAAVLLLTLRGTPFLFAGEELGLLDAEIAPGAEVDPGGRDGCRAPIPWEAGPRHGWPADPWLPFPPESDRRHAAAQRVDHGSVLHLYRDLLHARRRSPALHAGTQVLLPAPEGVVAFSRQGPDQDRRVVVVNFTDIALDLSGHDLGAAIRDHVVEISSDRRDEGAPPGSTLGPDRALILRPA
jgi:alpha-glucosidase